MNSLIEQGVLAKAFPAMAMTASPKRFLLSDLFFPNSAANPNNSKQCFEKSGMIIDRQVITSNYRARYQGDYKTLSNVLGKPERVPDGFYIADADLQKWREKRFRFSKHGNSSKSKFRGGRLRFPDRIDLPSRTIMTQEGGRTPNWNTHVIKTAEGVHRRLLPIELERLNMFPDNHTEGVIDTHRAFLMGNALVIGVVERIARALAEEIAE